MYLFSKTKPKIIPLQIDTSTTTYHGRGGRCNISSTVVSHTAQSVVAPLFGVLWPGVRVAKTWSTSKMRTLYTLPFETGNSCSWEERGCFITPVKAGRGRDMSTARGHAGRNKHKVTAYVLEWPELAATGADSSNITLEGATFPPSPPPHHTRARTHFPSLLLPQ